MFLTRVKSRGRSYLYLRKYKSKDNYEDQKKTLYRFGRVDKALFDMYRWRSNIDSLPNELKDIGCNRDRVNSWIRTIETGVHQKTGRSFSVT